MEVLIYKEGSTLPPICFARRRLSLCATLAQSLPHWQRPTLSPTLLALGWWVDGNCVLTVPHPPVLTRFFRRSPSAPPAPSDLMLPDGTLTLYTECFRTVHHFPCWARKLQRTSCMNSNRYLPHAIYVEPIR